MGWLCEGGRLRYWRVPRILLIEDDAKTGQAVRSGLRLEGCNADITRTGEAGLAALEDGAYDLVVLDWMLPGMDGLALLKTIRTRGRKIPVLLLTARDTLEDRVLGLDSGADDYLVKPFAFAELLARIRALLRRGETKSGLRMQVGDLNLDLPTRRVWRGDQEIAMTPREFELLVYLVQNRGQIVTRAMLARDVWREPRRLTPLDNVIDVHIAHLRQKLDEVRGNKLIHTVRGVGFVLSEDLPS